MAVRTFLENCATGFWKSYVMSIRPVTHSKVRRCCVVVQDPESPPAEPVRVGNRMAAPEAQTRG